MLLMISQTVRLKSWSLLAMRRAAPHNPDGLLPKWIQSFFILDTSRRAVMDTSCVLSPNSSLWANLMTYRQGSMAGMLIQRACYNIPVNFIGKVIFRQGPTCDSLRYVLPNSYTLICRISLKSINMWLVPSVLHILYSIITPQGTIEL